MDITKEGFNSHMLRWMSYSIVENGNGETIDGISILMVDSIDVRYKWSVYYCH